MRHGIYWKQLIFLVLLMFSGTVSLSAQTVPDTGKTERVTPSAQTETVSVRRWMVAPADLETLSGEQSRVKPEKNWFARQWSEFSNAVDRTFLVENRYKIFLVGLGNTILITVGALILGILLGLLVAIIRVFHQQTGKLSVLDFLAQIYLTVVRGTPMVVQLMIWAFVIFTSTNSIVVAIIGFGINSGAYVAEIVRAGILAVDGGQAEAGRSLGLTAWQTMTLIVLPQAFKNVLPALANEFIALIKETSIAGYIAVTDLTKAASLVRARTFDAFVPLLFVAAIYLLLVLLLTWGQRTLEANLRQSERK